ncbi:hypothetical protein [Nocardioides terrisoli]|uniref:hypothetical protein n=1 Tax=Nocardioides terrisoli TaxID=3388267 RepID=UPI00287B656B|nr:hypothetical protein [Nocardioides marmorisolisilvae]
MNAAGGSSSDTPGTPEFLSEIIDDAAIFPPGNAPLDRAVEDYLARRPEPHGGLVGGFVVSDVKLPELVDLVAARDPLRLNLVVTGGAGAIEGAVRWATRAEGLHLEALEFALRDEEDLAHNAQRVLAAVDALDTELEDVDLYVEPPRVHGSPTAGWLAALDELATREVRLKFRTGGVHADDFPTSAELSSCIGAALDRELPFKCTAGLHHAVRQRAALPDGTEPWQHGFLNVLRATRANLDGEDTVAVLEATDAESLLDGLDPDAMTRTRRWFTSFGSCSVLEPHDDLVELGLVHA